MQAAVERVVGEERKGESVRISSPSDSDTLMRGCGGRATGCDRARHSPLHTKYQYVPTYLTYGSPIYISNSAGKL